MQFPYLCGVGVSYQIICSVFIPRTRSAMGVMFRYVRCRRICAAYGLFRTWGACINLPLGAMRSMERPEAVSPAGAALSDDGWQRVSWQLNGPWISKRCPQATRGRRFRGGVWPRRDGAGNNSGWTSGLRWRRCGPPAVTTTGAPPPMPSACAAVRFLGKWALSR